MPLNITVTKKEPGVFTISPVGSIDSETYAKLEREIEKIMEPLTKAIILNMEGVTFISSMGLGVIFKTKKIMEEKKGTLVMTNLKPNIKKIFDLVKAIPSWMFETMEEADEYLDTFLAHKEKEEEEK